MFYKFYKFYSVRTTYFFFPYKLFYAGEAAKHVGSDALICSEEAPQKKKQIDQGIVMGFCVLFAFGAFFSFQIFFFRIFVLF